MLTGLDHIIIGVHDLEQAAQVFRQKLGLAVSGGGIHPSGGTANRIIVIGDTYIELIAVNKPEEASPRILERLAKGEGYLNFVLTSDDIEADSTAMKERGITIFGPTPGELRSADGRSRGWQRADIEIPELAQRYPFIIQHDSTGEERRFRLAGWQTPPRHPLGATQVLSTTIAVADPGEAARRFQHIYGLSPSDSFTGEADSWDAMLVAFPLGRLGAGGVKQIDGTTVVAQQSFELAVPLPFSIESDVEDLYLPEPGALARYLERFGESLCRMTLAVESLEAARRYLDEHGVTYTYKRGNEESPHPVLWIHPADACGAAIVLHEHDPKFVLSTSGFPDE
ncbi:MAG TPA: VOC family protein [Ktedonobacteraceae bacterium]|jgi:catechol 2,3-dioxygenase-like lactoylglutathione lyase family enzyme|nr:VOC family protein [Ktedonobacteraceae bacterium]